MSKITTHFTVVISGDGSATLDGRPVPAAEGAEADGAVLDALHQHARERGSTVTASVSDPAAGYVAYVEVAPDGSSRLLEQGEGGPEAYAGEDDEDDEAGPEASGPDGDGAPEDTEYTEDLGPGPEAAEEKPVTFEKGYGHGLRLPSAAEPPAPDPEALEPRAPEPAETQGDEPEPEQAELDEPELEEPEPERAAELEEPELEEPEPEGAAELEAAEPDEPEPEAAELDEPEPEAAELEGAELEGAAEPEAAAYALPGPVGLSPAPRAPALHRTPDPDPGSVRPNRRSRSRQSDDEYASPGLLNRPLIIGPAALLVAALVITPLVVLGSGGSGDDDRQDQAAKVNNTPREKTNPTELPTPTVSVSPSLTPSPTAGPSASKSPKPHGKDGVAVPPPTVTVTENAPKVVTTVTAKPARDTAATAVRRLAANDPSGRHICYRAYVGGQGWQKPVCDGTIAGTSGKNKAIKALNVSVSGTGGSAANAVLHEANSANGQGSWQPGWTAITDDGKDFYIGNPKKSGPYMTGFAINVGTGQICRAAAVHNRGWGDHQCANPRPEFLFGGTMDNDPFLEAVKLTV
ncbi:hypothetical protein [Streptomyces sp. NPDC001508]|uniref:hypothetical protein n=1 Tax=Streptomyces sp. NPDC001508 TaxID=3154656 RepID=UPI0033289561